MRGVGHDLCLLQVPPSDPLSRFLAGGLAGAVSRTATAPLERLRTMMMADTANTRLLPTMRKMWASGGFLGLWRGNLASVAKVMPQSAIQFAVNPVYHSLSAICQRADGADAASDASGGWLPGPLPQQSLVRGHDHNAISHASCSDPLLCPSKLPVLCDGILVVAQPVAPCSTAAALFANCLKTQNCLFLGID